MEELQVDTEMVALGKRIRSMREARGMGLNEFARLSGIDQAYLSRAERGEKNVTLGFLVKVANTFGVGLRDLF